MTTSRDARYTLVLFMSLRQRGAILGFITGGFFVFTFLSYYMVVSTGIPLSTEAKESGNHLLFYSSAAILLLSSTFCGYFMADRALLYQRYRKRQLFFWGLFLYLMHACAIAYFIIFSERNYSGKEGRLLGGLYLGLTGAALFSFIFVPIIFVWTFLLDRWRKNLNG